jgi:hypothetical protein
MPFNTDALSESLKRSLDNEKSERMYSFLHSLLQAVICNSEFYQITLEVLKLTEASFNQNAAKTAKTNGCSG